jgi:hypothetical protein
LPFRDCELSGFVGSNIYNIYIYIYIYIYIEKIFSLGAKNPKGEENFFLSQHTEEEDGK